MYLPSSAISVKMTKEARISIRTNSVFHSDLLNMVLAQGFGNNDGHLDPIKYKCVTERIWRWGRYRDRSQCWLGTY